MTKAKQTDLRERIRDVRIALNQQEDVLRGLMAAEKPSFSHGYPVGYLVARGLLSMTHEAQRRLPEESEIT